MWGDLTYNLLLLYVLRELADVLKLGGPHPRRLNALRDYDVDVADGRSGSAVTRPV